MDRASLKIFAASAAVFLMTFLAVEIGMSWLAPSMPISGAATFVSFSIAVVCSARRFATTEWAIVSVLAVLLAGLLLAMVGMAGDPCRSVAWDGRCEAAASMEMQIPTAVALMD